MQITLETEDGSTYAKLNGKLAESFVKERIKTEYFVEGKLNPKTESKYLCKYKAVHNVKFIVMDGGVLYIWKNSNALIGLDD